MDKDMAITWKFRIFVEGGGLIIWMNAFVEMQ